MDLLRLDRPDRSCRPSSRCGRLWGVGDDGETVGCRRSRGDCGV